MRRGEEIREEIRSLASDEEIDLADGVVLFTEDDMDLAVEIAQREAIEEAAKLIRTTPLSRGSAVTLVRDRAALSQAVLTLLPRREGE